MRISFRTESDATQGITAKHNTLGFPPTHSAMSACSNSKLCPCLLALDCWRITGHPEGIPKLALIRLVPPDRGDLTPFPPLVKLRKNARQVTGASSYIR